MEVATFAQCADDVPVTLRPSSSASSRATHDVVSQRVLSASGASNRPWSKSSFRGSASRGSQNSQPNLVASVALENVFNHSLRNSEPLFKTAPLARSAKGLTTTTNFDITAASLGARLEKDVEMTLLRCSSPAVSNARASFAARLLLGKPKVHAEPHESVRLPKSESMFVLGGSGRGKPSRNVNFSTTFLTFSNEVFLPSVTARWDERMHKIHAISAVDAKDGSPKNSFGPSQEKDHPRARLPPPRSANSRRERRPVSQPQIDYVLSASSLDTQDGSRRSQSPHRRNPVRQITGGLARHRSSSRDRKKAKLAKMPAQRPMGAPQAKMFQDSERRRSTRSSFKNAKDAKNLLKVFSDAKKARRVEKFGGRSEIDVDEDKEQLKKVFKQFEQDGDMPKDHAFLALRLLGYVEIDKARVQRLVDDIIKGSFFDFVDFCEFAQRYGDEYSAQLKAAFEAADADGSGCISANELVDHLHAEGIAMIPGIVREIICEIAGEDATELANVDQYLQFRNIIRLRGGFTEKEAEVHRELFQRYDQNGDGKLNIDELAAALLWIGCDTSGKVKATSMANLIEGIDLLDPGMVSEPEFLEVMRRYREAELARVTNIFYQEDTQNRGFVSLMGVVRILQSMGFKEATTDVVQECATDCNLDPSSAEFFFDDVMLVVLAYREHEGYLWKEIDEFKKVYELYVDEEIDGIGEVELGGMLRWLGFPSSIEQRQDLMAEVDADNSGVLDFDEFLKVTRRFREQELDALDEAFQENVNERGRLGLPQLRAIVATLGYSTPTAEQAVELDATFGKKDADFTDAIRYIRMYRSMVREAFNNNSGFTSGELVELRRKFDKYDPRKTGCIQGADMARLLAAVFPEATKSLEQRQAMKDIIASVDENHDGKIDWDEFLKLMRIITDRDDHNKVLREQKAALEAGFTHSEVRDFRKIYKMVLGDGHTSGGLTFEALKGVFESIVPSTNVKFTKELAAIFKEVDVDRSQTLDFAKFLVLMRRIQDSPWLQEGSKESQKPKRLVDW